MGQFLKAARKQLKGTHDGGSSDAVTALANKMKTDASNPGHPAKIGLDADRVGSRRQDYDRKIEQQVPGARGAAFSANVVGKTDYKDAGTDVSQRYDMGKSLLAKKFVGGDLTKGGTKKTRRKIRDAGRYTQFLDAVKANSSTSNQ